MFGGKVLSNTQLLQYHLDQYRKIRGQVKKYGESFSFHSVRYNMKYARRHYKKAMVMAHICEAELHMEERGYQYALWIMRAYVRKRRSEIARYESL